ncbi:MAG: thioredoxin domain-containing protein, partial [Nitrospira sp.]|nr:thioredoxin domain-containing protein [Nitrospira sp.]
VMPHFEKMADDNAMLLRNYLIGYYVFGDIFYKEIAEGMIRFIGSVLSDPEGGFYTSQDADVMADDEGGYFTWTNDEIRDVLDEDEFEVVSLHLLHDAGTMHHNSSKKVLYAAMNAEEISVLLEKDLQEVKSLIGRAKEKLLNARNNRETPYIDTTMYTSNNGMFISAYILGYRMLNDITLKEFAVKSIDKIMKTRFINGTLFHSEGTEALFDDYVHIMDALISVYEVTGEARYMDLADELMDICINKLWDKENGGFYDSTDKLLGIQIKGIEDVPHPSPNSICIKVLLKLHFMTGNERYYKYAEKALELFSGHAMEMGIHAGYYFCALDSYFNTLNLNIYSASDSTLSKAVLASFTPHMNMLYGEDRDSVVPCFKSVCYEPVNNPEDWKCFLQEKHQNIV